MRTIQSVGGGLRLTYWPPGRLFFCRRIHRTARQYPNQFNQEISLVRIKQQLNFFEYLTVHKLWARAGNFGSRPKELVCTYSQALSQTVKRSGVRLGAAAQYLFYCPLVDAC